MAEVTPVTVNGRALQCSHCQHREFAHQSASLDHVVWGGLFHFEGLWGHDTTIYVCARCGFAHFFMQVPEASHLRDVPAEQPRHERGSAREEGCLSCGAAIPSDATHGPKCGWSWEAAGEESP